jgi:hypothetical protein
LPSCRQDSRRRSLEQIAAMTMKIKQYDRQIQDLAE